MNEATIQELLLKQDETYIFSDKSFDNRCLLAVVEIMKSPKGELVFRDINIVSTHAALGDQLKKVYIKLVWRGYQYCIEAALELKGDSRIILKKIMNVEKHRLRRFFRVDVEMDYSVEKIDFKGNIGDPVALTDLKYVNISGGGFFFYSMELLVEGLDLLISLDLEEETVKVKGKVLRCSVIRDRGGLFGVAVEFIDVSEKHRDKILNYVLSIQRRNLSRGAYAENKQSY